MSGSDRPEFFVLTKRSDNLLHGSGDPALDGDDRTLFDRIGRDLAAEVGPHLMPDDMLVIHDPQPLAVGAALKGDLALLLVWRCHAGLVERNAAALTTGSDVADRQRRRLDLTAWPWPALRRAIAILRLPMRSRRDNALMVNALHRCSSIVAQVSHREGLGLAATEAMWKGVPVLVSGAAAGLRAQVEDGEHGRVLPASTDTTEVAGTVAAIRADDHGRHHWGRDARHRVTRETLNFTELGHWLDPLASVANGGAPC